MRERIPALQREPEVPRRRIGKLMAILILLFVIVSVILFFRSSLSKVSRIEVDGVRHLTVAQVMEKLLLTEGDSFFVPGAGELAERVKQLPPVKDAQIVKRFPGKVEVRVTEYGEVALEIGMDGVLRIVLENGLALPVAEGKLPDKPILTGWKADDAVREALCRTLAAMPGALLSDLSEIKPDPSNAYPDRIKLFTRSRFEVLTTVSKLAEKIPYLSEIVENREPGQIVMLEADTYMPFSAQISTEETEEPDKHKDNGTTQ